MTDKEPEPKEMVEAAFAAVTAVVADATVCLPHVMPGHDERLPSHIASGVVITTPKGRPVVLTVAHLVRDSPRKLNLLNFKWDAVPVLAVESHQHPDDEAGEVDVAIIVPRTDLSPFLRQVARGVDALGESASVAQYDWMVLFGFPAEYSDHRPGNNEVGFSSLTLVRNEISAWREPSDPDAKGCAEVAWVESEWKARSAPGVTPKALNTPSGMSGCGLWRYQPNRGDELFVPRTQTQLIGIQRSWDDHRRVLFIEPVERWRAWVLATMADVDARGI